MRIVIDMETAQSGSSQRGIGRLTLSLVKAIVVNQGDHEIILVLNGAFPESIKYITEEFKDILPAQNIRIWQGFPFVDSGQSYQDQSQTRETFALIRETFLSSLNPSVVFVMCLFDGFGSIASIGKIPQSYPTATFIYDLIPLIYQDIYLKNPIHKSWYMKQFEYLRRANFLLSDSNSSTEEAVEFAGFSKDDVVSVYAGKDDHFRPLILSYDVKQKTLDKYILIKPYIMYNGSIDYRKNIEGLIRALTEDEPTFS